MRSTSFHDNWFVRHVEETGLGTPVTIPHDAMLSEPRTAIAEGGLNVSWFEGRDYVYTKKFTMTQEELQRHNVLEFEGVYRKAEVFVNGKRLPSGLTATPISMWIWMHTSAAVKTPSRSSPAMPTSPIPAGIPARASTAR